MQHRVIHTCHLPFLDQTLNQWCWHLRHGLTQLRQFRCF